MGISNFFKRKKAVEKIAEKKQLPFEKETVGSSMMNKVLADSFTLSYTSMLPPLITADNFTLASATHIIEKKLMPRCRLCGEENDDADMWGSSIWGSREFHIKCNNIIYEKFVKETLRGMPNMCEKCNRHILACTCPDAEDLRKLTS